MPDMPDWVHVWFWLRFIRSPQVLTPLLQQDDRDPEAMTKDEYENFVNEWVRSGAPLTSAKQVVLAMGGQVRADDYNPLIDEDDGIPF